MLLIKLDLKALMEILKPALCITSIICKFLCLALWNKALPYSIFERIKTLYIYSGGLKWALQDVWDIDFRMFILSSDSFLSVLIWYVQMFFVSNITLRIFRYFLFLITMSSIFKLMSTSIFFIVKKMYWDFSAEKVNPVL